MLATLLMETNLPAAEPSAPEILRQVRLFSKQPFLATAHTNLEERFSAFRSLLATVAAADAGLTGATPDEATFLRVARQAGERLTNFDELVEYYGRPSPQSEKARVQTPPWLEAKHLTEDYRPAWEALLLAPPSGSVRFMQSRFTITAALAEIGSPESLPVLELAFAATCQEGKIAAEGSAEGQRQFRIMQALNTYTTAEALQVMLRCLARAEAASGGKLPKLYGHDLRERVVRFLKNEDKYKDGEKWREILKSFPKNGLNANQRELLNRATKER